MAHGLKDKNYDLVELCKRGLLNTIKSQIESELTEEIIAPIENRIRDIIKANLAPVTLDSIESFRDIVEMQDRIAVRITVDNETTEHTV